MEKMINLEIAEVADDSVKIVWNKVEDAVVYQVFWADKNLPTTKFRKMVETKKQEYILHKATHVPHYFKVICKKADGTEERSNVLKSPVKKIFHEQLEKLNRGLIAVKAKTGIFLGWRLMLEEVDGYSETGMTGTDFVVYKNGERLVVVTDSTNYIDTEGTMEDFYAVSAVRGGIEYEPCKAVQAWKSGENYIEIPMQIPKGGVTPAKESYEYRINDMSVGDVDGDGEYEYIVKWDPSNSQDVSIKGYTGKCLIDCYRLDGTLLWRLDMGVNIRAGAHYTQFIVYDFDGDGKAEMSVKTAPGTKMTIYNLDGTVKSETYITMPKGDLEKGYSHSDCYVCSAKDYYEHLV